MSLTARLTASDSLVFDLESDGLLDKISKVHCMCLASPNGEVMRFRGDSISEGLDLLNNAGAIVGHNIIGFDIPALKKVYGWEPKVPVLDTLVLSRLAFVNVMNLDAAQQKLPKALWGRHSLKSWGLRLGVLKGDFGADDEKAWDVWTQEMEDYCAQDVVVTQALVELLDKQQLSDAAVSTELELQEIICHQERHGFLFDRQSAERLLARLSDRKMVLLDELRNQFPSRPAACLGPYKNQEKRAQRLMDQWSHPSWETCRPQLEAEGIKFKWKEEEHFNPNSEQQIIERLQELGWVPTDFTEKGQPKMDEPVLVQVAKQFPQAAPLVEYSLVEKRIGQLSSGANGWLQKVGDDGRMHGRCNTMGTVTYRFTHSSPNMAQVPAVRSPYGKECRSLFTVPEGSLLVGCDVSGLELRILAHYLARWDGGAYGKLILDGDGDETRDIHVQNMRLADLSSRDQAKTFIYALIYGAGNAKLGQIALPNERSASVLVREGKKLRSRFLRRVPALGQLETMVRQKAAKEKYLKAIDGRRLPVRSAHSALNALIQSAGAIAVKVATIQFRRNLESEGYMMGDHWSLVAHVHDEWQTEVRQEIAEHAGRTAIRSIQESGDLLGIRCPLKGKYRVGRTWADTH